METIRSYSSGSISLGGLLHEATGLYYSHSHGIVERARSCIADISRVESLVNDRYRIELRDRDILEIGPGQFLGQMTYFAMHNRVVGIDLDIIVNGFHPLEYLNMFRANGLRRTMKTVGRKLLGFDYRYSRELRGQLGIVRRPRLDVLPMDVCRMSFAPASFDFVYSRAVFHHLPDPASAISGIAEVLRPGGICYVALHPYTSETGCLDPRIYTERASEVQGWPHLRPSLTHTVDNLNTYLNRLRFHEWERLFQAGMPEVEFITPMNKESAKRAEQLQSQGELRDYSLEELAIGEFAALWQKPTAQDAPGERQGN